MDGEEIRRLAERNGPLAAWAQDYYERHAAGWSLHIYLADGNWESHHLAFCVESSQEKGDAEGQALALALLAAGWSERRRILRLLEH